MPSAPTTELGQVSSATSFNIGGGPDEGGYIEETERNDALRFPMSIETYDRMRNDPQVAGLLFSGLMPIRRYRYFVDPLDSRPEVYERLAEDLGLPVLGQTRTRRLRTRDRFSWGDHLRHALLAMAYGFYDFEQYGRVVDGLWRLRKLAPRPPQTIAEVRVAADGGLVGIRQNVGRKPELIPVNRLVVYCWEREGGNWYGRSALRSLYGSWNAKRDLIGIDVTKNRRNGMGVPTAKATEKDVTTAQLKAGQEVAKAWRGGETASAALPYGVDVELKGVTGTLPDTIASVRYHDQQMSRAWAQMVAELGQTPNGSRALGEELGGQMSLMQDAVADWLINDVANPHIVEDWVDWNFGETEPAPAIGYDRDESEELAVADLVSMVDKGLIVLDDELQEHLRERYNLPAGAGGSTGITVPDVVSAPLGAVQARRARHAGGRQMFTAARAALSAPTTFRRDLLPHEAASGADFEGIDAAYRTQLEQLLATWEDVSQAEIDDVVDQVRTASSLETLATVQAAAAGGEILADAMRNVAATGAAQAAAEARTQGVDIGDPDLEPVNTVMGQRAAATDVLLARSLSEAGGREALRQAGGSLTNDQVADGVRDHLEGLSSAYLADRLGGAVQTAQNYGRAQAMAEAEQAAEGATRYYASELLDERTCPPCDEVDGHEFEDWDDMNANYSTGGYVLCEGGDRCRGTAVAVYGDEAPSE